MASEPDDLIPDDDLGELAQLRAEVRYLAKAVDTLSKVLQRMVIQQQMAAALPQIVAAVEGSMTEQLAAPGGWDTWLNGQSDPTATPAV